MRDGGPSATNVCRALALPRSADVPQDPYAAAHVADSTSSLRRVGSAGRGPAPGICFRFHDTSATARACFAIADNPGSRSNSTADIRMSSVAATREASSTDDNESRPSSARGV